MEDHPPPIPDKPETSPPPDSKNKPFAFSRINLALLIIGAVIWSGLVCWGIQKTGSTSGGLVVSYAMGSFMVALLFSGILSYIAYRLAPRSSRVGNIAFAIVFAVYFLDQSLGYYGRIRNISSTEERGILESVVSKAHGALQRYRENFEGGSTSGSQNTMGEIISAYETGAANAKGRDGIILSVLAEVVRRMQTAGANVDGLAKRLDEAGGPDLTTIKTKDELASRIRLLDETSSATEKFLGWFESLPRQMENIARAKGLSESEIKEFVSGNSFNNRLKLHLEYRKSIVEFCNDASIYLNFLAMHWGEWHSDSKGIKATFDSQTTGEVSLRSEWRWF